jgi:hypothetical protein
MVEDARMYLARGRGTMEDERHPAGSPGLASGD